MPQDPQHVLKDSSGNDLGYFFADANDDVVIEHAGSGEQAILGSDGLSASAVDVGDGPIGENEMMAFPSSGSTELNPTIGDWVTPDANNPVWMLFRLVAETDGSTRGAILVNIDEDGGTTSDYAYPTCIAQTTASGDIQYEAGMVPMAPGASFRVQNVDDPNSGNAVPVARKFTL